MDGEEAGRGEATAGHAGEARRRSGGRSRREAALRHHLVTAVYLGRVREASRRERQLAGLLGERADGDFDLEIARHWLGEQAAAVEAWRQAARLSWIKLSLTALPLALATLLTVLLAAVLIWG